MVPKASCVVKEEEVQIGVKCGPEKEKNIQHLMDLIKLVGLQLHAVTEDYVSINKKKATLLNTVSQEEEVLRRTEEKVARMQKVHGVHDEQLVQDVQKNSKKEEVYQEMLNDAKMDYEGAVLELKVCTVRYEELLATQACLRRQFDALMFQLTHMKRGEVGIAMRPTPHCSIFDSKTTLESNPILVQPCAVCLNHFPLNDIVVSTCGHLYHPWCARIWFRVASTCADVSCGTTVHPSWFRSFGFGQLHTPLQQLAQTLELEKEQHSLLATLTSTIMDSYPDIGMFLTPVLVSCSR